MSDLGRSLSVAAGDIENNQPPPRASNPAPTRPGGVRTCASAPHSAVQFGTRVVVDGQANHYVNFKLPAFSRIEHVVCFDDGGEQTLRGDRCHFFRVVLKHILPAILLRAVSAASGRPPTVGLSHKTRTAAAQSQ
jgi:hypothetical protein